jgi:hypothetical protein
MPQVGDAESRQRAWLEKGSPRCDHAKVSKEYYLGADTGDYVCSQCGETGVGRDWPERERDERVKGGLAVLKHGDIETTRKLIELRREQHVQRMSAALKAGDREEVKKAEGSRDACETMLADLAVLEAELVR